MQPLQYAIIFVVVFKNMMLLKVLWLYNELSV